jgi:hypothetical protein
MRIAYLRCLSTLAIACFALAGCQATPPEVQTRIVEVPTAKPYRFITYTPQTDESTARQIRRHNRAHSAVIAAEKKAKEQN